MFRRGVNALGQERPYTQTISRNYALLLQQTGNEPEVKKLEEENG
jgi:hypothetical protein